MPLLVQALFFQMPASILRSNSRGKHSTSSSMIALIVPFMGSLRIQVICWACGRATRRRVAATHHGDGVVMIFRRRVRTAFRAFLRSAMRYLLISG